MCYLLILDDDRLFCDTLKDVLMRSPNKAGFSIEACQEVSEAIDKVRATVEKRKPFDIMLIDQRLSYDTDGIEIMKELRKMSPDSDVIIFTGYGDMEGGQCAYAAGAFRYLQKPFQLKELLFVIESLIEWRRVQKERNHLRVLNEIGRRVTRRAALDDLSILLEDVREQIGGLMDVSNFIIALPDYETDQLDFRLHYEHNERQEHHFLPMDEGLTGHLISLNQVLYLPAGEETYCVEKGIAAQGGEWSKCWVGIPLRAENRVIGGMILQNYEHVSAFSTTDVELLQAVADQIAGVIQASFNAEAERKSVSMLAMMPYVSSVLMKLANTNEDHMWYTLLTFATASYGFGFNRAWLFLIDPLRTRLRGKMGIGNVDFRKARNAWEEDIRQDMDFNKFMEELLTGKITYTPLDGLTKEISVDPNADQSYLSEVFKTGIRQVLSRSAVQAQLPPDFVQRFDPLECAVLPVRGSEENIGIVVVDNKHNGKLIDEVSLDRLETFLNLAGLILDNLHHRKSYQTMVGATSAIMGEVEDRPLKDTLTRVCIAASRILAADWVVVYPLKPGTGSREARPLEYDLSNVGCSGPLYQPTKKDKPRPKGTSAHILNSGKLVVPDIEQKDDNIADLNLKKHAFLVKTGIKAFIGIPIRDTVNREDLGVMYLDYLMPRKFSEQDVYQAELFASLLAIAMRNARQAEIRKVEMANARRRGLAGERELTIYQRVLQEALVNPMEGVVARAVTNATIELLSPAPVNALLLLRDQHTDEAGISYTGLYYFASDGKKATTADSEQKLDLVAADVAIIEAKTYVNPPGWQAYIPVLMGERVLGLLFVDSHKEEIGEDQLSALERFSSVAALALDNVQRQNHLRGVLEATKAVMQPIGLQETLNALIKSVHEAVPELSAATLWYLDPEDQTMKFGPSFGLRNKKERHARRADGSGIDGTIILSVMNSSEPIFAENALEEKRLVRQFVYEEDIRSVAALPLIADNEKVGVMFLNFRHHHHFTHEEKLLFPLLAEITAASISDAMALELEKRQRKRLDAALEVARAVGASLDINQIIHSVLSALHVLLADTKTIPSLMIYNEEEDALEFASASREFYKIDNPEYLDLKWMPLNGPSIACKVAVQTRREKRYAKIHVDNVRQNDDYLNLRSSTRSELCVGLIGGEDLLGVLVLESDQPSAFGEDEEKLIEGVAQQISLALQRSRQGDKLSFTSIVAASYSWAAEMAHDINREVGKINNYADWITNEVDEKQNVLTYAHKIKESAGLLGAIGPWGQKEPESIKFDVEIRKIFTSIGERQARPLNFTFDLGCEGHMILASRSVLERILRHLVRNASDAMQGERIMNISTRLCGENTIEMIVTDSGPGIDEKVYPLLFKKPVPKESEPGRSKYGGTGLLFVRNMVEQVMEGKIRALPPETNRGAAFEIRLPAFRDENNKVGLP